ncbi:MAG TPA: Nramp family divalent metal transporter [bacterium]|nr:Nramp family divalent metal transporter [bacterium]
MNFSLPILRRAGRAAAMSRLAMFFAIMGPGIITQNVDNDAGGITTYSLAGANFGYALLWTMIPVTIALYVIQEMASRLGVVTGKGLADLIRERFGVRTTVWVMLVLLAADFGNTLAEFSGLAAGGEIFGVSKYVFVPIGALTVWLLVVRGTYRSVERIFLGASAFYVAYVVSGILARPDWGVVLRASVVPTFSFQAAYLLMFVGVIGTTIAPWMQFYLQSTVVEKGITVKDYGYTRTDVFIGSLMTDIVAWFIIVACGATIFAHHIHVETVKDAALALVPLAGRYAAALFALGLINASLFSASVLPLATSHYVCESLGFEAGVDRTMRQAPVFYGIYIALIVGACIIVLLPNAPLLQILFLSQVANGILLPFILVFMLLLVNQKRLMGAYTNSVAFNVIAWVTTVAMIILTLALVATQIFPFGG